MPYRYKTDSLRKLTKSFKTKERTSHSGLPFKNKLEMWHKISKLKYHQVRLSFNWKKKKSKVNKVQDLTLKSAQIVCIVCVKLLTSTSNVLGARVEKVMTDLMHSMVTVLMIPRLLS